MRKTLQIFSNNLKNRRKAMGLTQKELAEKISYSEKAVSKWESGAALPPSALLPLLASILDSSIDELLLDRNEIKYYLGIDGGGSKTEFLLMNSNGVVMNRLILGPSNPDDLVKSNPEAVLREGVFRVLGDIPFSRVSVFAGVSGSRTVVIKDILMRLGFSRIEAGDSISNIIALIRGEEYVAVNIGVGSIVFAKYGGVYRRAGGYGYILGDEGGSFAVAKDGFTAALHMEDGSGPSTLIREYILRDWSALSILDNLFDFYRKQKGKVGDYAKCVFEAYRNGDAVAGEILRRNYRYLADHIKSVLTEYTGESVPVYLFGGMGAYKDYILPLLEEYLKDFNIKCNITVCETSPVFGAVKNARFIAEARN